MCISQTRLTSIACHALLLIFLSVPVFFNHTMDNCLTRLSIQEIVTLFRICCVFASPPYGICYCLTSLNPQCLPVFDYTSCCNITLSFDNATEFLLSIPSQTDTALTHLRQLAHPRASLGLIDHRIPAVCKLAVLCDADLSSASRSGAERFGLHGLGKSSTEPQNSIFCKLSNYSPRYLKAAG